MARGFKARPCASSRSNLRCRPRAGPPARVGWLRGFSADRWSGSGSLVRFRHPTRPYGAGLCRSRRNPDATSTPHRWRLARSASRMVPRANSRNSSSHAPSGLSRRRPFSAVQRLSRPVTPEVAGSSPVAPVYELRANRNLSSRTVVAADTKTASWKRFWKRRLSKFESGLPNAWVLTRRHE
jgi:hypothetical protein